MEDKLQLLTKKIYEEGVAKAEAEAVNILGHANEKAAKLVEEAELKASRILEQAKRELEELKQNVSSEIQLAARQCISSLKQEVANAITFKLGSEPLSQAIAAPDFMKEIMEVVVRNWSQNGHSQADLALILPENAHSRMDDYLTSSIQSLLGNGLEIQFSKRTGNGFRIGPADGSYVVSFAEQDFDNLFKEYLRPKTIELLFGNK